MKDTIPKIHHNYDSLNLTTGIGFSQIPEQVRQQSIRDGFYFNLLVVSRRGLGASTLINSLFSAPLVKKERTDSINTTVNEIVENGIRLTISVTTYHGEDINKVIKYINTANEEHFEMEQGLSVSFPDKRMHCCLYLVPGDKMSDYEIEGLKELGSKINIIPVITKADMFTDEELKDHREKINRLFRNIQFYDYEENDSTQFPLAVIASENVYEEDGSSVRGRRYAWGFIDIENEKYSDFKKLQRTLICEKFIDLIYKTDAVFYNQARKALIRNESLNNSRTRLAKILNQMEAAIDEKYAQKIQALESEDGLQGFSDILSLKATETPAISE
ncbi:uncharacterized protein VICG_02040 [Vittaforma corneae ATCC 50505]|uniref:Septin-type G domain-containing protein n=1 Tax=Vittaforma corneae (strain ATCC 50505) TaxID=993615 RepID=L2GK60_VITCO|nr:uncharacterized protein VICG_02040 [Vittaforma corneae ATCC 50505]ELA40900.1 hypothetical protein VICG_02040 [Vittaforma corneae ATCC 50505]